MTPPEISYKEALNVLRRKAIDDGAKAGRMPTPNQLNSMYKGMDQDFVISQAQQILVSSSPEDQQRYTDNGSLMGKIRDFQRFLAESFQQNQYANQLKAQQLSMEKRLIAGGAEPTPSGRLLIPEKKLGKSGLSKRQSTGDLMEDLQAALAEGDYGDAKDILDIMKQLSGEAGDNSLGYAQLAQSQSQFEESMAWNRERFGSEQEFAREQEKQRIQEALANLQRMKAESRASIGQNIVSERRQAAPSALPPSASFIPGWEPGGLASKLYGNLGASFTPRGREFTTPFDPESMMQPYLDELARIQVGGQ